MASRRNRNSDDAKPAKLSKSALRKFFRLFRYIRPYRWAFAAGLILLLFTSLLSMAFPGLMGKLVDASSGAGAPTDAQELFDLGNI